MVEASKEIKHDVVLRSRKKLEMSGINDVLSYDEKEIVVQTDSTGISIVGEGLKIEKFDAENGELIVNGLVSDICYFVNDTSKKKRSITNFFK